MSAFYHFLFTMSVSNDKLLSKGIENMGYYTLLVYMGIFALLIMQLFVYKSNTLTRSRKRSFHWMYAVIAIAAFFEWSGHMLENKGSYVRLLLLSAKVIEHSLAPVIPCLFILIVTHKPGKSIYVLLAANVLLQLVSAVTGFAFYVDADGHYYHTRFYWIYLLLCILSIEYMLFMVLRNIRKYQYSGGAMLFSAIMAWMVIGIAVQLTGTGFRVSYAIIIIASIMVYVFTLEMIQQTDELTELLNRHSYENYISHVEQSSIVLFFDADNYKALNDTYGHAYGDSVLKHIGYAIKRAYAPYGKCFRYGGDEFCVILTKNLDKVNEINHSFFEAMGKLREKDSRFPRMSVGYAFYNPDSDDIRDVIAEADTMMYMYKSRSKAGNDTVRFNDIKCPADK